MNIESIGENMYSVTDGSVINIFSVLGAPKKQPVVQVPKDVGSTEYQRWGSNNLLPSIWRGKLEKTTTAFPLLVKSAETYFGKGVVYWREVRTKNGVERDYSEIPEVEEFLEANDVNLIMLERWMDLRVYNNLFCEFSVAKNGRKIVAITHQEAEFCRFGKIENNVIKNVLISSDWATSTGEERPYLEDYKISRTDIWDKIGSSPAFVTHDAVPSPGRTLYANPAHVGLFDEDGWLDYSVSIPRLMNRINKNGFLLKYHIEIPYDYWEKNYSNWATLSPEDKKKIMDDKITEMNNYLLSSDAAGKNFYSNFGVHPATGKEMPGWRINELKDPIKRDQFLTSLQEADIQTARAVGFDASLSNISVGSNTMGAGSGSNKRVGMDNAIAASYAQQMIVLRPLNLVGKANDWPVNLKWGFEHEIPTSLNENKSGTKTVS